MVGRGMEEIFLRSLKVLGSSISEKGRDRMEAGAPSLLSFLSMRTPDRGE